MKATTSIIFNELFERYPKLTAIKEQIWSAYEALNKVVTENKTVFVCGNGGSAADSEHIVGELMKSFKKKRLINNEVYNNLADYGEGGAKLRQTLEGSIKAVSLTSHIALSTAFANDKEPSAVFAQQLYGLSERGDALIALSTSGNSENCYLAAIAAKATGVSVIAMTGRNDSRLSEIADVTIKVPETETFKVQELHLPVYHCLCAMLEEENF